MTTVVLSFLQPQSENLNATCLVIGWIQSSLLHKNNNSINLFQRQHRSLKHESSVIIPGQPAAACQNLALNVRPHTTLSLT
jgi:hypothetical protein